MLRLLKKLESNRTGVFRQVLILICLAVIIAHCKKQRPGGNRNHNGRTRTRPTYQPYTRKTCLEMDFALRARHNTCFLRPDTGPCRADILQWYFDARQIKCYQFFWGGCQGNGNRFETKEECFNYCHLDTNSPPQLEIPNYCSLAFDYGTCFGHYNRWGWDRLAKTCKRRIYSGCGGNQNNFETREECLGSCLSPPNNTLQRSKQFTTCVPFNIPDLQ